MALRFPHIHAHHLGCLARVTRISRQMTTTTPERWSNDRQRSQKKKQRRERGTLGQLKIELPQSTVVRINRFLGVFYSGYQWESAAIVGDTD